MLRISRLVLVGSLAGLAACSQDTPTAPSLARAAITRPAGGSCTTRIYNLAAEPGDAPNVQHLGFTGDCTLRHLGAVTVTFTEVITFTGPGSVLFTSADLVYTAANGDLLYATVSDGAATVDETGAVVLTGTEVYNGGTGRFSAATGSAAITGHASVVTMAGAYETSGSIAY